MNEKTDTLPAVYIIFTLLNAIRRGIPRPNIWREFRRQKITLKPRLAFWLALCKQAGLVDDYKRNSSVDEGGLRVTGFARRWLNKPSDEQTLLLIEAWQNAPKNKKSIHFRKKLLWKLKFDQPLTPKDRQALNGPQALGLVDGETLTHWGRYFLKTEGTLPTPTPTPPCVVHESTFIASLPHHADLLWDLETLLRPSSPGVYPLARRGAHLHKGDPQELITLLERGLQSELPKSTRATILGQPSVQIRQGLIIEFSEARALRQLRRQPDLRKHVEQFLSPRHILIAAANSKTILKMFERRGVFARENEASTRAPKKRSSHIKNFQSTSF